MAARLTFALMWLLGRLLLAALHGPGAGLGRVWRHRPLEGAGGCDQPRTVFSLEQRDDQRHRLCAGAWGETGKTAAELCWL